LKQFLFIIVLFVFSYSYSQAQEGVITVESSSQIKELIQKKIAYNKTIPTTSNNYRIQIFYGSENGAIRNQNKFREYFPNTSTSLEFDSPNWKVKVGSYKNRLQADKHLQEFILIFGDAIVIEPKKKN